MKSFIAATVLLALPAFAAQPDFGKGGAVIGLQYGYGIWNLDRAKLAAQVGQSDADIVVNDTRNGHSATLRLGYNILGHATVEALVTATGWNLTEADRGGGGFITGGAHWHPLELFLKGKPRFYDASVFLGLGHGLMGQNRGMDGLVWQYGLGADFFFSRILALGVFFRSTQLNFNSFYLDYNNRALEGATLALPQGSGGSFMQFGATLTLRVSP